MFKLKVLMWLHTTESGDRSELRLHGREEVLWTRIASDPLDCVGIHCTKEDCYVHRARAEAETADLVVINHALLLADVEVGGGLLPEFDHLVIDEAHHLEEAATRGLRQEVDGPGLVALLERLVREDPAGTTDGLLDELHRQPHLGASGDAFTRAKAHAIRAAGHARELFHIANGWVAVRLGEAERREESVRITQAIRDEPGWALVQAPAEDRVTAATALEVSLRHAVAGVPDRLGGEAPD